MPMRKPSYVAETSSDSAPPVKCSSEVSCVRRVRFAAIIAAALDPIRGAHEGVSAVVQIARRSGELLSVQAIPLPRRDRSLSAIMVGPQPAACALVIQGSASVLPSIGPQLLRHVYGLTAAEVQIASAIAEGQTARQDITRWGDIGTIGYSERYTCRAQSALRPGHIG